MTLWPAIITHPLINVFKLFSGWLFYDMRMLFDPLGVC